MSIENALIELTEQTLAEIVDRLRMLTGDESIAGGRVSLLNDGGDAFTGLPMPAVSASVSYVDGVTGGNVVVMPFTAARVLAARMMGAEPEGGRPPELDELELSAVGEAMNQMMAGAAAATGAYLQHEIEITPPDVRTIRTPEEGASALQRESHRTSAELIIAGTHCRLIQLIPSAFILRMTRAMESSSQRNILEGDPIEGNLIDIPVRVWAEFGRTKMPIERLISLPPGEVVALDHAVDEPIDVYADGMHIATGRIVTEDDHLELQIESVLIGETDLVGASETTSVS